jgi:hypothetical protein
MKKLLVLIFLLFLCVELFCQNIKCSCLPDPIRYEIGVKFKGWKIAEANKKESNYIVRVKKKNVNIIIVYTEFKQEYYMLYWTKFK